MSLQTEEIKTDELKDKDSVENKKTHGKVLKIACASGGFIAVVALCILSSRFSWFGVQADNEGISYSESVSSYSSTTPAGSEKAPTKANKPDITSETTAATNSVTMPVCVLSWLSTPSGGPGLNGFLCLYLRGRKSVLSSNRMTGIPSRGPIWVFPWPSVRISSCTGTFPSFWNHAFQWFLTPSVRAPTAPLSPAAATITICC